MNWKARALKAERELVLSGEARPAIAKLYLTNDSLVKQLAIAVEALKLYHEAWNGEEGDWRAAMSRASKAADEALSKIRGGGK